MPESRTSYLFGTRSVIVCGDRIEKIPEFDSVDVIVSSDNNYLLHGGGVSESIWEAAGKDLDAFVAENRPTLSLGDVWPSNSGALNQKNVKYIYHAVTVDYDSNTLLTPPVAKQLYSRIFELAAIAEVGSLALPLLGSGGAGLQKKVSANLLAEVLVEISSLQTSTDKVYVSCHQADLEECCQIFESRQVLPIGARLIDVAEHLPEDIRKSLLDLWQTMPNSTEYDHIWKLFRLFEILLDGLIFTASKKLSDEGKIPPESVVTSKLSPGRKFEIAVSLLKRLKQPVSKKTQADCFAAISAQNRLAHNETQKSREGELETCSSIMRASSEVLQIILAVAGNQIEHGDSNENSRINDIKCSLSPVPVVGATVGLGVAGSVAGKIGLSTLGIVGILGSPWGMLAGGLLGVVARGLMKGNIEKGVVHPENDLKLPPKAKRTEKTDISNPQPIGLTGQTCKDRTISSAGQTQPVRELHKLLLAQLDDAARKEFIANYCKGYAGEDDMKILEYCVRVADPAALLVDQLGAKVLRKILKDYQYDFDPTAESSLLARMLLKHLGFPVNDMPRGLESIKNEITKSRERIRFIFDIEKLNGCVMEAAHQLEFLLQLFVRFLAKVLLGEATENYLRRNSQLDNTMKLSRCSLGKLISILDFMRKNIEETQNVQAENLLKLLGQRPIIPSDSRILPELRNKFAHYHEIKTKNDIESARESAEAFFEQAEAVLNYLGDPQDRIFPRVVKITGITVDRWGRRVVEAETDDGKPEMIFVDEDLLPGTIYLMHPLTNPIRVDPILVCAGDLTSSR